MTYVKAKLAREKLGVSDQTLRKWGDEGIIDTIRIGDKGCRLYNIDKVVEHIPIQQSSRRKILYCRVSSYKQKEDLQRQIKYLKEKYPNHEVIEEIASGINFKRKGLKSILDSSIKGMVEEVVVAHRDRLCRIAFEHFSWLFSYLGVNLVVDGKEDCISETDLANDLFEIIHVFSCRHYGARRKYTSRGNENQVRKEETETNQLVGWKNEEERDSMG